MLSPCYLDRFAERHAEIPRKLGGFPVKKHGVKEKGSPVLVGKGFFDEKGTNGASFQGTHGQKTRRLGALFLLVRKKERGHGNKRHIYPVEFEAKFCGLFWHVFLLCLAIWSRLFSLFFLLLLQECPREGLLW